MLKSNPEDVTYRGIDPADRDRIVALAQDPSRPSIRLIDRYLTEREMAALYRSCDVGVFPYRAEGFCVPILEAMACGTPSIVPHFGACLDFCSAATSFLIPARRMSLPVGRSMAINSLGFREEVTETDFCEVEVATLRDALRAVAFGSRAVRAAKSRRGVAVAHGRFAWPTIAAKMTRELARVVSGGAPVRVRRQRARFETNRRNLLLAMSLYAGR